MRLQSLDELQTFIRIAESGSITAAAQSLQLPQTTVSRRLAVLEERLDAKLIHRSTRSLHLSEAGRLLLPSARAIVEEATRVERALEEDVEGLFGLVRIAVPTLLIDELLLAVGPLMLDHPALRIELLSRDRVVSPVAEGVDVVIWGGPLTDSSLVARKLLRVDLILAASQSYLDRHGAPKSARELQSHAFVQIRSPRPGFELIDDEGRAETIHPEARLLSDDARAVQRAIESGFGIGITSTRALARSPSLVRVLPGHSLRPIVLSAVYPSAHGRNARLDAVVEHLQRSIAAVS